MMDLEEDMYNSIFTALKHPIRLRILRMLDEGANTYSEILKTLGVETGARAASEMRAHLSSINDIIQHRDDLLNSFLLYTNPNCPICTGRTQVSWQTCHNVYKTYIPLKLANGDWFEQPIQVEAGQEVR